MRGPVENGRSNMAAFREPRSPEIVKPLVESVMREFRHYLERTHLWSADQVNWDLLDKEAFDPVEFLLYDAPGESVLRKFAIVILSIVPSTSPVERGHKVLL